MNSKLSPFFGVFLGIAALAPYSNAATDNVIEEIVVTATKRGESNVQDTPLAIEAFSEEELSLRGVREFSDWAYAIPGLEFRDNGPGDKQYIIRGVSSRAASPVGVYFNEAVLTANNTTNEGGGRNVEIKLYDIERIEALKGPQGTLYGANSMAGTVKIVSKEADFDEPSSYLMSSLESTDGGAASYQVNAMVNVPLIEDRFAVRLVAWHEDIGGYIDQVRYDIENANSEKTQGYRVQLRYLVNEQLTLKFMGLNQSTDVDDVSRFSLLSAVPVPAQPPQALPGGDLSNLPGGEFLNNDYVIQPWLDDVDLYSFSADWDWDSYKLTAVASLLKRESLYTFDGAATIFSVFNQGVVSLAAFPQKKQLWSNELRLASVHSGPFNFVLGAYYQQEDSDFDVEIAVPSSSGRRSKFDPNTEGLFGPGAGVPGNAIFGRTVSGELDQLAIFGELNIDLSEELTLLLGGRYFQSTQLNLEQSIKGIGTIGAGEVQRSEINSHQFTGKLALSYHYNDDALVYLTYSEGFRVGGINQVTPFAPIPKDYKPDSLFNYELGWKTAWLDRRLLFNGALYISDWQDIQVVQSDNVTGIFNFVTNGGEARLKGLELQLTAMIASNLSVALSGAYTDARITKDQPQITLGSAPLIGTPLQVGDKVPAVPRLSAAFSVNYEWLQVLGSDLDVALSADIAYVGESTTEGNSRNPYNYNIGGYSLMNIRSAISGDDHWEAKLFVNNVLNDLAVVDIIADSQNPIDYTVVRPRTLGLEMKYNF